MKVVYSNKIINKIKLYDTEDLIHDFSKDILKVDNDVRVIFFSLHPDDLNYLSHIVKFYRIILVILIENLSDKDNYHLIPDNYDFIIHTNQALNYTYLSNEYVPETPEQLNNFILNNLKDIKIIKDRIYYIVAAYRPGAMYFTYELEKQLDLCENNTLVEDDNDLYDVQVITFDNQNYIISCSPFDFYDKTCDIAKKYNFNIVKGKPYSNKSGHFPLDYPDDCIFTLESNEKYTIKNEDLMNIIKKEWEDIKKDAYNDNSVKQKIKLKK